MSRSEETHGATAEKLGVVAAIARQLCPRCRRGRVFRGVMAMNETCVVWMHFDWALDPGP